MEVKLNANTHITDTFNNELSDHWDFDNTSEGIMGVLEYLYEAFNHIIEENAILFDEDINQAAQDILDYVILKNHIELPDHPTITDFMIMSSTEVDINIDNNRLHKHFNTLHESFQWLNNDALTELSTLLD